MIHYNTEIRKIAERALEYAQKEEGGFSALIDHYLDENVPLEVPRLAIHALYGTHSPHVAPRSVEEGDELPVILAKAVAAMVIADVKNYIFSDALLDAPVHSVVERRQYVISKGEMVVLGRGHLKPVIQFSES